MSFSLYHLPYLPLQPLQPNPISSFHEPLFLRPTSLTYLHFLACTSGESFPRTAYLSGSAAEFPEQVVGDAVPKKPKKRRSVAGVDQEELLDPEKLADQDSFFCDFNVVKIHHKALRWRLMAVDTYFEAPERVTALILVAPATVVLLVLMKVKKEDGVQKEKQMEGNSSLGAQENPFPGFGLSTLYKLISGFGVQMLKRIRVMVGMLYTKALCAVVRSAFAVNLICLNRVIPTLTVINGLRVRMVMNSFGIVAIRNAWYDANQVPDDVVRGYTKPLGVKDWEMVLLEYTIAMLTGAASKLKLPLTRTLAEIKCPVLIAIGDADCLLRSWNAECLSQAIPGSSFEVIQNCEYLPHEERAEESLTIVESFLQSVCHSRTYKQCHDLIKQQEV